MSYCNFKQNNPKWKDKYYSGGTISGQGCGPTSIADAVYDLCPTITPQDTAKWMEDNGCSCHGSGTYYSGMIKGLKHFGYTESTQLNYTSLYGSKKKNAVVTDFLRKIRSGKYIGIACMGKSIWTSSGHYVFVHRVTTKAIYIYDPWNTKTACEVTNRSAWEPYIKYLFLIKKPIMHIQTTKKVNMRKQPAGLTKNNFLGKFKPGNRLAVDKVKGKYYHIMYHDVWVKKSYTKVVD